MRRREDIIYYLEEESRHNERRTKETLSVRNVKWMSLKEKQKRGTESKELGTESKNRESSE